jgi:hypothetical protein
VLNAVGKKQKKQITFIAQPSRSPDFNCLDLGAWFSLVSGVPAAKALEKKKIHQVCLILNLAAASIHNKGYYRECGRALAVLGRDDALELYLRYESTNYAGCDRSRRQARLQGN